MVKMPVHLKDFPSDEEHLGPPERLAIAKRHLMRFCYLCNFQAVYYYHHGTTNVKHYQKKLQEYCLLIEPLPMFYMLRSIYESVLCRRDEVALVHAVYLMSKLPANWITEMRSHFPELVKTDTDLFLFCKYAAILHHLRKKKVFCKTVKKAIVSWYKRQTPEAIAQMFAANRGKHGFTHRGLIRLCHINDNVLGTKYLYQSFTTSCTMLLRRANRPLPPLPVPKPKAAKKQKRDAVRTVEEKSEEERVVEDISKMQIDDSPPTTSRQVLLSAIEHAPDCDQERIRKIILGVSTIRTTTDPDEAVKMINEYDLKYEHLPHHLLQYPQVLKAVSKSISCLKLIECFNSKKVRRHFSKQEVLKVCRARFQRKGGMQGEGVDPIMLLINMDRLSIEQPLKPTNNKNTSRGRLVQFSKQLYRTSFWETKPTNLRIHITMNLQQNYTKKILRHTRNTNYMFAAAALAFTFYKVEQKCDVFRYTENINELLPINWNKKMDFISAFRTCSLIQNVKNYQRLYTPIKQANENERVYDLFIVIVPSGTRGNKNHSSRVIADYIDKYRIRHSTLTKFVIVDLLRYKRSMRYSQTSCENILEICGLDEHTVPLIYNFAFDKFD